MKWSIYIITNKKHGVLYIGLSKNFKRRIYQHKNKAHPGTFSAKYNLDKLVYFERFEVEAEARLRERRMKKWDRN